MEIIVHQEDLSEIVFNQLGSSSWISVDTETLGLNPYRDRLCLVQLYAGGQRCHLIQFGAHSAYKSPHLKKLLSNPNILKIFHYARFDVMMIKNHFDIVVNPIYCTKIASRLVRTYTDRHSLKDLCNQLLGIEISKQEQSSDWGREILTENQKNYAASDVLHLNDIKEKLDTLLRRENRIELAKACFKIIPTCVEMDLLGWNLDNILNH